MSIECYIKDDVFQNIVPGHRARKDEGWAVRNPCVYAYLLSVIVREAVYFIL